MLLKIVRTISLFELNLICSKLLHQIFIFLLQFGIADAILSRALSSFIDFIFFILQMNMQTGYGTSFNKKCAV